MIWIILSWRLNSQLRHAGLDPASSAFLDSRIRGNDTRGVFSRRSNMKKEELQELREELGDGERLLKAMIKSLENKHLNPAILESFLPYKLGGDLDVFIDH